MSPYFHEEQRVRQPWLLALLVVGFLPILYVAWQQSFRGDPWGLSAAFVVPLAFMALFLIWFLNLRLVTEVREDEVYIKFVLLWRARRIPLERIRSAAAVTYSPIWDYGGWGIRWGRKGMAYNVSGDRGVQLELETGLPVLIGSQRAEQLAMAIEQRMALVSKQGRHAPLPNSSHRPKATKQ